MKDEITKKDWAMKKGMQMVQILNDEASEASQNSTDDNSHSETRNQDNDKKRVHWSGMQMQGFQTCVHVQHCQNMGDQSEMTEHNHAPRKESTSEEACELSKMPSKDTTRISSLDTGSTFDSTNNENSLTETVKATQSIALRTNIGKREMTCHGETPGPTE